MASMQIGKAEENRKPKGSEASIQFSFLAQMGHRSAFRMIVPMTKSKHIIKKKNKITVLFGLLADLLNLLRFS